MCIKLNRPLYSKQLLENWSSYACEPRKGKAKIPVSAWTILTKVKIRHVQFCHLPLSGKFTIRIVKHLILLDVGCHSLDSKINWRAKATAWVGLHATAGLLASGWYGSRLWPKKSGLQLVPTFLACGDDFFFSFSYLLKSYTYFWSVLISSGVVFTSDDFVGRFVHGLTRLEASRRWSRRWESYRRANESPLESSCQVSFAENIKEKHQYPPVLSGWRSNFWWLLFSFIVANSPGWTVEFHW